MALLFIKKFSLRARIVAFFQKGVCSDSEIPQKRTSPLLSSFVTSPSFPGSLHQRRAGRNLEADDPAGRRRELHLPPVRIRFLSLMRPFKACFASSCTAYHILKGTSVVVHFCEGSD